MTQERSGVFQSESAGTRDYSGAIQSEREKTPDCGGALRGERRKMTQEYGGAFCAEVKRQYERGLDYKARIDLFDTVEQNENFFIGRQWEGVTANGLPTPVFNFLKRAVLFAVASVTADNPKLNVCALPSSAAAPGDEAAEAAGGQLEIIGEHADLGALLREFARNAAVDGDGCLHAYFDPTAETGQPAKGAIRTEIVENTRVFFGNTADRRVQSQPYIIISSRVMTDELKRRAERSGADAERVKPDADCRGGELSDEKKTTLLLRYRRDPETGSILASETTGDTVIRPEWDTGLRLYPLVWLCWDYVQDSCHGQAMISGLIPNQIFINKLFAMSMISLMTTAYPRVIYDKTRIAGWDNRVGAAIGINGGDVAGAAKIIDPAAVSPQIAQFIELAVGYTQSFLGATASALGDAKPDNTSAILALQRASALPLEITKQSLRRCVEELGRIYLDFMAACYGLRWVTLKSGERKLFDFARLRGIPMSMKIDAGPSAYWSEIASLQTLDNLLTQGKIDLRSYLERLPEGYIARKQELIDALCGAEGV